MIFLSGRFGSLLILIILILLTDGVLFKSEYLINPLGKWANTQVVNYQKKQTEVKNLQQENAALKLKCGQ